MDVHILELEKAKSWFTLAQLFIILAGFLFASSSVAISNAQKSLDNINSARLQSYDSGPMWLEYYRLTAQSNSSNLETYKATLDEYVKQRNAALGNASSIYSQLEQANSNFSKYAFIAACIFTILSFVSYVCGLLIINKIKI